jgi:hypothetical protein
MVRTEGNQSPDAIAGGKIGIEYAPTSSAGTIALRNP